MIDDYHVHCVESLAWHLERADAHANALGLAPITRSLRRLRKIVPEIPDSVPAPEPVVPLGPQLITDPIEKRSLKEQSRKDEQ